MTRHLQLVLAVFASLALGTLAFVARQVFWKPVAKYEPGASVWQDGGHLR
mgnify:CR=1 FL=1